MAITHIAALCMAVPTRNASNQEKWSKVGRLDYSQRSNFHQLSKMFKTYTKQAMTPLHPAAELLRSLTKMQISFCTYLKSDQE